MLVESYFFFTKALGSELGAFMMRILDGRLTCHIMNTHRRPPSHTFMMWIACKILVDLPLLYFSWKM